MRDRARRRLVRGYALRALGLAVICAVLYSASTTNALVSQTPWVGAVLLLLAGACLIVGLAGVVATGKRFSAWWERPPR